VPPTSKLDITTIINSIAAELTLTPTTASIHEESLYSPPIMSSSEPTPTHTQDSYVTTHTLEVDSSEIIHHLMQYQEHHNRLTTIRLLNYATHDPVSNDERYQLHIDGGANRSITNNLDLLLYFQNIKPYRISGVNAADQGMACTGLGYLPWKAPDGMTTTDTIISPSDVILNHINGYESWTHYANMVAKRGYIDFIP
jgi:hypothetical protein